MSSTHGVNIVLTARDEVSQKLRTISSSIRTLSSVSSQAIHLMTAWNTAMFRTEAASRAANEAQARYNEALLKYGPQSTQAIQAAKAMEEAQRDLGHAQTSNLLLMASMIGQAPALAANIINMVRGLRVLTAAHIAENAALVTKARLLSVVSMLRLGALGGPLGLIAAAGAGLAIGYGLTQINFNAPVSVGGHDPKFAADELGRAVMERVRLSMAAMR